MNREGCQICQRDFLQPPDIQMEFLVHLRLVVTKGRVNDDTSVFVIDIMESKQVGSGLG